jgi:hypothetical protein
VHVCHENHTNLPRAGQPIPAPVSSERSLAVQMTDTVGHALMWEEVNGHTTLVLHFMQAKNLRRKVGKGGFPVGRYGRLHFARMPVRASLLCPYARTGNFTLPVCPYGQPHCIPCTCHTLPATLDFVATGQCCMTVSMLW